MLSNQHFYHRITRKMVVAFGTMFNNLRLVRYDKTGAIEIERITVPLSYSNKEKFYKRITQDPELTKETAITLPRMAFNLDAIAYDPSRKVSIFNNTLRKNISNGNLQSSTGIPYNFNFTLSIYVRNVEDGTQIVEQIIPYFDPDYTLSMQLTSDPSIKTEVPIILDSITKNTGAYGSPDDTRILTWDLNFTMKGYFYGPTVESKLIRTSIANSYIGGGSGDGSLVYKVVVTPDPLNSNASDDFGFTTDIYDYTNNSGSQPTYQYTQPPLNLEANASQPTYQYIDTPQPIVTNASQPTYQYANTPQPIATNASQPTYQLTSSPDSISHSVMETHGYDKATNNSNNNIITCIPPYITSLPTTSGTGYLGQPLTATNGTWGGTGPMTYTYQWYRESSIINGETSNQYTLTSNDIGFNIFVHVTATNACGSFTASSSATHIVCIPPTNMSLPTISGTVGVGQTLTASHGTWTGTPTITYSYQWYKGSYQNILMTGFDVVALSSDGAFGTAYEGYLSPTPYVGAVIQIDGLAGVDGFTITNHYSGKQYLVSEVGRGGYPSIWGYWYTSGGHWMKLVNLDGTPIQTSFPDNYLLPPTMQCYIQQYVTELIEGATSDQYTVTSNDADASFTVEVTATNECGTSALFSNETATLFSFDADYLLITYSFTDGTDLDTRTSILSPVNDQNKVVGWGREYHSGPVVYGGPGDPPDDVIDSVADWSGDNTGVGVECVKINLARLKYYNPAATYVEVKCNYQWYGAVGVEPCFLTLTLWKGGTPIRSASTYTWTNPTATNQLVFESVHKQLTYYSRDGLDDGVSLGTIRYDLTTHKGKVIVPDPSPARPVNISPPTIIGTLKVGETLSINPGIWQATGSGPITYKYQWVKATLDPNPNIGYIYNSITTLDSNNGSIQALDILHLGGNRIYVVVVATNSSGSSSARSILSEVIQF